MFKLTSYLCAPSSLFWKFARQNLPVVSCLKKMAFTDNQQKFVSRSTSGLYKLHDWLSKLRESKVAIWVKRNFCSNLKSRILQLLFPSKISASNLLASQSLRLLYVYTLPILSLYVYNKIPFDIFKTFLKSLRVSSLLYASNKSYSQGRCDIEFLIT